ncbi:MAG: sulfotransferase, partial [Elainellaceae cyanobacterium]
MNISAKSKTKFKFPDVFIVGSGRSGTTLLASILNASEDIYIPYESDFIARAFPYYHQDRSDLGEDDYRQIFRLFQLSAKQDGWGLSEDQVVSHLKARAPQTFAEVNSALYEAFHQQEKTEDLLWGIKAPVLIASLERIHKVFPQAKIIHVVRDGRDVYLSYKKVHETSDITFGPKGVIENALYWTDGLRRVSEFLKAHPSHQVYELRYDELLTNPEAVSKQLCDFLGIEYRPSMHENFSTLE